MRPAIKEVIMKEVPLTMFIVGCHHLLARLTQQRFQSASVQENCAVGENPRIHYIISEIE